MNKAIILLIAALMVIPLVNAREIVKRTPNGELAKEGNQYTLTIGGDIVNIPNCQGQLVPFTEAVAMATYNGQIIVTYCEVQINLTPYIIKNNIKLTIENYTKLQSKLLSNETQLKLSTWFTTKRGNYEWIHTMDRRFIDSFGFEVSDECILKDYTLYCDSGIYFDFTSTVNQGLTVTLTNHTIEITGIDLSIIDPIVGLQPDGTLGKDSYVDSGNSGTNYGTSTSLFIGSATYASYIEFNFTGYSLTGATNAYMEITPQSTGGTNNYSIYNVTSAWKENVITYTTQPTRGKLLGSAIGGTTVLNITIPNSEAELWIGGNSVTNNGLIINGSTFYQFYSSDSATASQRPRLVVTYTSSGDTTAPTIAIQSPIQNKTYAMLNISLNYTINEANIDKCWYINTSGKQNISLPNCANVTIKVPQNGKYNITIYANDTAGNLGNASVIFYADITDPIILVQSPINFTVYTTKNISLNYTISDLYPDDCWYQNTSGQQNISLPNCRNVTIVAPDGTYKLRAYMNDTAGHTVFSEVNFTINTMPSYPTAAKLMVWDSALNGTSYAYMSKDGDLTIRAMNVTSNMQINCITANGSSIGACNSVNATGNVWVKGCVIYNGGILGSCV